MADERIIKIIVEVDDALRKLDALDKKIEEVKGKASGAGVSPANAATAGSSASGLVVAGAGTGVGSMVSTVQRPAVTEGDMSRAAEQAVARAMSQLSQGLVSSLGKYAGGLPLTASPAVSGVGGGALPAMVSHLARQRGYASVEAMDHVSAQQVRSRAEELVGQGVGLSSAARAQHEAMQPLARTGTGGPDEMQMGRATGVTSMAGGRSATGRAGRGGSGGGRGGSGGGDGGPTDMADDWWLGGGGTEDEWHQYQTFRGRQRVDAARRAMEPRDPSIGPGGGVMGAPYGPFRPPSRAGQFFGGISEGFQQGNMAAFNALMGGWAIGSSAIPLETVNAPALQAARQFTYDPNRAGIEQRRQRANISYGLQVDKEQQGWDEGQAGLMEWLAKNNLGGPAQRANNMLGTIRSAADMVQGPLLAGYLGAGVIRGGLAMAGVQGGISGAVSAAGSAIGSGFSGVGSALGIGAGVGIAPLLATGGAGIGLQAGGEALADASGIPNASQILRIVSAAMPGPMGDAARLFTGFQVSGAAGQTGTASAAALPPSINPEELSGGGGALYGLSSRQRIINRAITERARTGTESGAAEFAAETEQAQRAQTGYGISGGQLRLGLAARGMAISRRTFDEDQERERVMLDRGYGRQLTALSTATLNQQNEIHIGAQQSRDAIGRGLGRSQREIGIGYGENVEDINRGSRENAQDIILGSALGGMAGALIQNRIQRRRALAGAARGRDRALGAAGRGAGDAGDDVDIGERQSIDASNRAYGYGVDAAGVAYSNAKGDQTETQKRDRERFAEQEAIQAALLKISQDELTIRKQINDALEAGPKEIAEIFGKGSKVLAAAFETVAGDLSRLLEGMAP